MMIETLEEVLGLRGEIVIQFCIAAAFGYGSRARSPGRIDQMYAYQCVMRRV